MNESLGRHRQEQLLELGRAFRAFVEALFQAFHHHTIQRFRKR
jgi:hypothetical protein